MRAARLHRRGAALPGGVVGVLDGQLGERRGLTAREGAVERAELAREHAEGPAVGDDVVHAEEEHVLVVGEAQELGPEERALLEVEGAACLFCGTPPHLGFTLLRAQAREVGDGEREGCGRMDAQHRPAVDLVEGGAK